jgi:tubulin polyglutamylase TTLL4
MSKATGKTWIVKPPAGSCGRGISIVSTETEIPIGGYVVSEYIPNPLLIDGFKVDLRVYVLLTCLDPLRAFVYRDGLARFATQAFASSPSDRFAHLTNASLSKRSRRWRAGRWKWRMSSLLDEVEGRFGVPRDELFDRLAEAVRVALAALWPALARLPAGDGRRFELLGFDLLFDSDLNVHLLEINTNPSINTDERCDFDVKAPLIARTLSVVGIGSEPTVESEDAANLATGLPVARRGRASPGSSLAPARWLARCWHESACRVLMSCRRRTSRTWPRS